MSVRLAHPEVCNCRYGRNYAPKSRFSRAATDVDAHLKQLTSFIDAGYDEIYVNQIGPDQRGFFEFYAAEILPQVEALS